jgi:hypothetical protein
MQRGWCLPVLRSVTRIFGLNANDVANDVANANHSYLDLQ